MYCHFRSILNLFIRCLFCIIFILHINCEALDNIEYDGNLFKLLPLKNAIKEVHGNGNLKIAVFTDIFCKYCRQLKKILDSVDNITIYNFMVPFLYNSSDNFGKYVKIWCNNDKLKAWNNFMSKNIEIQDVKICKNPIKVNMSLFNALGFYSVPIIIFPNGKYYVEGLASKDLLIYIIKENQ